MASSSTAQAQDSLDGFMAGDLRLMRQQTNFHVPTVLNNKGFEKRIHKPIANMAVDRLQDVNMPGQWRHSPRFHTRTGMREARASEMRPHASYDVDGDGHPDSSAQVYGSYFAWAPAFVALMRARFGRSKIILANSGGSLSDSSLSGVTIEMEGCTGEHGGPHMCSNALDAQMIASTAADVEPLSILGMTHSEAMPADKQCAIVAQLQTQYPWVQAGTDFFDGSQVVC